MALVLPLFITLFGQLVLHLWNWLMPAIFGLPALTFWQAIGLLALSWIFFGSWRGFAGHRPWRRGMRSRWEHMTPEEREHFRRGMAGRCGPRPETPAAEPNV
jgi:hypothetical protein